MVDISVSILLLELEIYSQTGFQQLSLRTNWILLLIKYFGNKLHYRFKNSNNVDNCKIKLDDFRKNGKKNKSKGYFWKLSDELLD